MCPLIELQDIHKAYDTTGVQILALRGLSLRVQRGEFVAIVGASGSGKSSLLHIIGCLDRPTKGRYLLDGQDMSGLSLAELAHLRNRTIGFVFQGFNLLKRYSALENVAMPLVYGGIGASERRRRAWELLQRVGLGDRVEHRPNQLSGGEQQRVAIARALVSCPRLLVADEPTGNLDSRNGNEILALFRRLHHEQGQTIVLVTHDSAVAAQVGRQVTLRDGLIENDTVLCRETGVPAPQLAALASF